ncbi:MAG: hypothetical protein J6T78_01720 [Bacteroidaceae bacterium]|nr:hypothetical protein [Bacteroidaceae bacterium]
MKAKYEVPQMVQVTIQARHLVSASRTNQGVYIDDPHDPGEALTIEIQHHSIWDEEW